MAIRDVSFNRLAIQDYREARAWYAERSAEVAARFVEEVDAAVKRILRRPIRGRSFQENTGGCASKDFHTR